MFFLGAPRGLLVPPTLCQACICASLLPRKLGDGLFLRCCKEVAELYPKIKFDTMIIDNCCMQVGRLQAQVVGQNSKPAWGSGAWQSRVLASCRLEKAGAEAALS